MARVTAEEVKAIMDNCELEDSEVDVYIGVANTLINEVFANCSSLAAGLMKEIERWYSAHLIACTRCRTASDEKVGDASIKYTGKWEMGLTSTSYGQVVKQLDTTGKMSNLSKKPATIFAIQSFES